MSSSSSSSPPPPTIPKLMKGIVRKDGQYNADYSKILQLANDLPVPTPLSSQILVKVVAVATNPIDSKFAEGDYTTWIGNPRHNIVGFEMAGRVVAIGSKVSRFKVGDEVFGDNTTNQTTFAEYCAIDESYCTLKPSNVSFIEAAGVALAGLTALQSLRIIVVKDRNVIIRGASGGVGTFGVQLARILGAKSIVAISSQVDLVANLGATEVKNYKTEKWEDTLKGRQFDGFFDCIGGYDSWQAAQLCLKHDGNYVTIVGDSAGPLTVGHLASTVGYNIARKFKSLFGSPSYVQYTRRVVTKDLDYLSSLLKDGSLKVIVDSSSPYEFSTAGAIAIFNKQISGTARGKLVMQISD